MFLKEYTPVDKSWSVYPYLPGHGPAGRGCLIVSVRPSELCGVADIWSARGPSGGGVVRKNDSGTLVVWVRHQYTGNFDMETSGTLITSI